MIQVHPGQTFEAGADGAPTGLTGTISASIVDPLTGDVILAPQTAGIVEYPSGSGYYTASLVAPSADGQYSIVWDFGADPQSLAIEELDVIAGTIMTGRPGGVQFEASVSGGPTGLVGTIGVQIVDTVSNATVVTRTVAGIVEAPAGSGYYTALLTAPDVPGTYAVVWDRGTSDPESIGVEEFVVHGPEEALSGVFVVTLIDYTPPPREDGVRWTKALIQESVSATGPFVTLETKWLSPLDADPEHPRSRSFTTELATIENGGWYRVVFVDTSNDEAAPSSPQQQVSIPYTPSLGEIAVLLRSRTKDSTGNELGAWTPDTRPTDTEVDAVRALAIGIISSRIDPLVDPSLIGSARSLVALQTALLIELTYFQEQINSGRSPYPQYKVLLDGMLAGYTEADHGRRAVRVA